MPKRATAQLHVDDKDVRRLCSPRSELVCVFVTGVSAASMNSI